MIQFNPDFNDTPDYFSIKNSKNTQKLKQNESNNELTDLRFKIKSKNRAKSALNKYNFPKTEK